MYTQAKAADTPTAGDPDSNGNNPGGTQAECCEAPTDDSDGSYGSYGSDDSATDTPTDTPTDDDWLSGARECCDATGAAACCDVLDSATITRPAATIFLVSVTAAIFI